ncbi:MFS transporter [Rhodococcus sp. D2-41]|uniref:MFS transporter n=1 Tax=Speluncibacter jeojiensis TaxID=2710754 RepID=A0A9X4LYW2_9ACTN|nr:MFS transporter [Rhodococcus sp. D2-41]MDG3010403.1 MFS transporter [Rhodococcus sp. D2-41]MDG3014141.1 MFS transporter [Corynebacteriales bacterium D3-21]
MTDRQAPEVRVDPTSSGTPPDPRRWRSLAFICLAQLMVVLDGTVVNIALPHAQADLGFSDANKQWVITAYALAFGGLLLLGGRIADMWGRRRTFIVGLIGFAAASALGGAALSTGMLMGARAVQGMFGALLAPAALSLLTVTFTEPRERAKAFGVFGAIVGGGAAIGLILGGVLTEYLNWRWTLYINVAFAAVAVVGAVTVVREPRTGAGHRRLDVVGATLASAGLAALVFGFSRAATDGWSDTGTVAVLIASAVLLGAFAYWQTRAPAPLLPLRVVLERNRGGAFLSLGLAVIGMFGLFLFMTFYLQVVLRYSPVVAGVAFLPMVVGMMIGSTQIGARLTTRVAPRVLMTPGLLVAAGGLAILAQIRVDSSYAEVVLPGLFLMGVGLGTAFMPAINLATHGIDEQDAGVASAMVNTSQQIGGAIGTALLNTIATTATASYLTVHAHLITSPAAGRMLHMEAMVHGFSTGIWWGVGAVLLAAAVSFALITTDHPAGVPRDEEAAPVAA